MPDTDTLVTQIISARLGPTPQQDPVSNGQCDQEYCHALANFITDIDISDCSSRSPDDTQVSHGSLERDGITKKVVSLLKDLQPHRERPSKDRSKRFAAGNRPSDMSKPEHHDLQEFDYWIVLPIQKQLQAAEVFILGQVVYISEGDKPCRSASSKNPNVSIMFLAHIYLPESSTYTICGKSGVCKARKVLLSNVNNFVRTEENGNITLSELPMGYKPFHDEIDLQTLIPSDTTTEKEPEKNNEDGELYLVERIVKK